MGTASSRAARRRWPSQTTISRSSMKRSGPPKRRTPMTAKKRMNKVNADRKAKRKADDLVYGSFFQWVKTHPCAAEGEGVECFGEVTAHHLKSVGSGGQDAGNLVPL